MGVSDGGPSQLHRGGEWDGSRHFDDSAWLGRYSRGSQEGVCGDQQGVGRCDHGLQGEVCGDWRERKCGYGIRRLAKSGRCGWRS